MHLSIWGDRHAGGLSSHNGVENGREAVQRAYVSLLTWPTSERVAFQRPPLHGQGGAFPRSCW